MLGLLSAEHYTVEVSATGLRPKETSWTHTEVLKCLMHSWMRNRSLEGPIRSALVWSTNGNLIPQQLNPPATPNSPTDGATGCDYIYRVRFSSTSSLRTGVGAFVALDGATSVQLGSGRPRLWCVESWLDLCLRLNNFRMESCGKERLTQGGSGRTSLGHGSSMCFVSQRYSEDGNTLQHQWGAEAAAAWWLEDTRGTSLCCVRKCRSRSLTDL